MHRPAKRAALWMFLLWMPGVRSHAEELASAAFRIRYDQSGIRSLKREGDRHDTDYVAADGALGGLVVRYRTTANGDWRELREALLVGREGDAISYTLGMRTEPLGAAATATAPAGAAGLRALNDGLVPKARGRREPAPAPVPGVPGAFTWSREENAGQWVQYTFPSQEEVANVELFWVTAPASWRLLYQEGGQWKEVAPRGPYGRQEGTFNRLEFAPVKTGALRLEVSMEGEVAPALAEWRVGGGAALRPATDLKVDERFAAAGEELEWKITLANPGGQPVEVGDLAVPLPFAERFVKGTDLYTRKLLRHSLLAGHGSWVWWQRCNAEGPFLVMTPQAQTKFEYADQSAGVFTPYIHGDHASAAARALGGTWRLPTSTLTLAPRGQPGSTVSYSFRFHWAQDVDAVRERLVAENKFDTTIVPGMTVPVDLPAQIALRTKNKIIAIEPEHPGETEIEQATPAPDGRAVWRVQFSKLGENRLMVRYGDGQWMSLEFFVTEPLETLIQKRAAFLAGPQQHKDLSKWYAGAYGDWDQKNEVLRGPEDRDGLSTWLTDANDDAGNARPAFLASKNVFFPQQAEIESLELYISRYLWGGMQMTEKEKYPFAIYGIPNWKVNRESLDEGRNGKAHVWRIYDYPHIALLYYRMFQIARFYPERIKHLDAATYLERAYRTAVAYWTVPAQVERWSANSVATMNEAFLPELIDALEAEGKAEWARTLRAFWEGKVEHFVNDPPNLYGSEFSFDSTAFESTGAFARYALRQSALPGDFQKRVSPDAARRFAEFQLRLNMADRGWLETTYYQLGSDYRASLSYLLSYMSQMGGWSILDWGLSEAGEPAEYLRLGYASILSSWALVNSGASARGAGCWFPSASNDGAAGGGFVPEAMGRGWIGKEMRRGSWHYSAEQDVGFCGALRAHATILTEDPLFGEMAYGGVLERSGKSVRVIPRDGLRVRFHVVRAGQRLHLELDHDGFAKEKPIAVADDLGRLEFSIENRSGPAHQTGLSIGGLPAGGYVVNVDGREAGAFQGGTALQKVSVPVGAGASAAVVISRK